MELPEITRKLLAAKNTKGLTFADLGKVVGRDEVWAAARAIALKIAARRQVSSSTHVVAGFSSGWQQEGRPNEEKAIGSVA